MTFADDGDLKHIIRRAMTAPLLSPERELELTQAYKDRQDPAALDELLESHLRMSVSTAIKFRGYGLPLGDLIQEGAIGLLEAARRFDPDREVRFCTYAGWWIRAAMQDYILRNWSIVRVGSKSAHKTVFFNLSRIRAMIDEADQAPWVGRAAAAERFRVTSDDIEFMTSRLGRRDQSLNATIAEDGDTERLELVPDERETPDQIVEGRIDGDRRRLWVETALQSLSARERRIIQQRFYGDDKVTLAELGESLKLSKERVRQIEKHALGKLRSRLSETALERRG